MYASVVAPLIAVIAFFAQVVFGVNLSEELQSQIAEAIINVGLAGVATYGVIKGQLIKKQDKEA